MPELSGYAVVEIIAGKDHWATLVDFIRDDRARVTLPLILSNQVRTSYLVGNTLPLPKSGKRPFEVIFHTADGGVRTVRKTELGARSVLTFDTPERFEPPEVGFVEFRCPEGRAGFFATATYHINTDRGILRPLE
jgi:hypothetical protein